MEIKHDLKKEGHMQNFASTLKESGSLTQLDLDCNSEKDKDTY